MLLKVLIGIASVYSITRFFTIVHVKGNSMFPSMESGDSLLVVKKWPAYWLKRGNIIVIKQTVPNVGSFFLVKRVTGLPEDTLIPDDKSKKELFWHKRSQFTLPKKHLFIESDNKNESGDSNHIGPIAYNQVIGLVLMKLKKM